MADSVKEKLLPLKINSFQGNKKTQQVLFFGDYTLMNTLHIMQYSTSVVFYKYFPPNPTHQTLKLHVNKMKTSEAKSSNSCGFKMN